MYFKMIGLHFYKSCIVIDMHINCAFKRSDNLALRKDTILTKNRILSVCVRLFLEQGYHPTPISRIVSEANISPSTFQNIFKTKDGVLSELIEFMFSGQFGAARGIMGDDLSPVYTYAIETAIQLALTEFNENLRDIYLDVYSLQSTAESVHEHTAAELQKIFGEYFPQYTIADFYEIEIGTAGIMRGYMAKKCDVHFMLQKKLECFLTLSMRVFKVPEEEQKNVLAYIKSIDICAVANSVMQRLFAALEMKFDFTLSNQEDGK